MMKSNFVSLDNKMERFYTNLPTKAPTLNHRWISSFFHFLVFKLNPFLLHLAYFILLSLLGYAALYVSKPKAGSLRPKSIDVFFTSVSATTVSSMSTVEMEVFSDAQLIIMTILMLAGGEVLTSLLGLQIAKSGFNKHLQSEIELTSDNNNNNPKPDHSTDIESRSTITLPSIQEFQALRYLSYVVLGYLLVVHMGGSGLLALYVSLVPNARNTLKSKAIQIQTFAVFTTVSTFANCGFVPTNENMIVFNKNSGLLLLLIPQILLGNTMYPVCLRALIWGLSKTTKRAEYGYLLKDYKASGYSHLMSKVHCCYLGATVLGLILVQLVLFCSMEWNSGAMAGLSSYQKFVGSLFQVVNSRHTGESIVDLSAVSSAVLVVFVVMMYLPPYTCLLPAKYGKEESSKKGESSQNQGRRILERVLFSNLTYLAIFITLICITERQKIKEDPLNFNVLTITIEVISAYGNVGFSTGYSCERQLKPESSCKDAWTGFVGRWSNMGKFILILVMFFGRLKKFNLKSGKAWILS